MGIFALRWREIASRRVDRLIGLVRCSSQPASRLLSAASVGSVGRQRENGYRMGMSFRFPLTDRSSGLQTSHHGHLQIHQHQMRMPGNYALYADLAILGEVELEAAAFEVSLD